jgi:hypothetical protein
MSTMGSHIRRWCLWLFFTVVSIGLLFSLRPCPAFACSCPPLGTPIEALNRSAAVFVGTVVAIEAPSGTPTLTQEFPFIDFLVSSGDPVHVMFEVSDVWKGPAYRRMVVTTAHDSSSCGYPFHSGEAYLVYASDQGAGLTTYLCSRTTSLVQAQADLVALGSGRPPTLDALPSQRPSDGGGFLIGGLGLLMVVVLLLVVWKRQRIASS